MAFQCDLKVSLFPFLRELNSVRKKIDDDLRDFNSRPL
jgi:hypothetical protein